MNTPTRTERNSAVTTAPVEQQDLVLYGPNGQALTTAAVTDRAGDWEPVQMGDGATVWERPRLVVEVPDTTAAEAVLAEAHTEAGRILDAAQAAADHTRAEAASLRARTLASANHEATTIREDAAAEVARKDENGKRLDLWMARAVIAGAVGLTATGEYSLARLAHFPAQVAWLLPFVIDVYVIQAFRRHRDILQAIGLTIAANVVYHLAAAGMFGVTTNAKGEHSATWWLIALVASIASVILWRMHVITAPPKVKEEPGTEAGTGPVQAATGTDTGTTSDVQESSPVPPPVAPSGTAHEGAPEPVLDSSPVPPSDPVPVPARKPVQRGRSTGSRKPRRAAAGTARKAGTEAGTAAFEEHVATAREWLAKDPSLSGTDIGKSLGTGDSYGRRVKRAALEPAAS
jgi:hypothetical protein